MIPHIFQIRNDSVIEENFFDQALESIEYLDILCVMEDNDAFKHDLEQTKTSMGTNPFDKNKSIEIVEATQPSTMNFCNNHSSIRSQPQDSFNLCDIGKSIQNRTQDLMNFHDNYDSIQSQPQDSFNLCDNGENIQNRTQDSMNFRDNYNRIQSQPQDSFNLCDIGENIQNRTEDSMNFRDNYSSIQSQT